MLREMGETPADVLSRLEAELDAFGLHLATRAEDWQVTQPGREWSPAQELEHVIKVNDMAASVLRLLLSERPLRPSEPVRGELKDGKRVAPPASLPSAEGIAWADAQAAWQGSRERLTQQAAGVRPTPERTLWHPYYGELDALDWLRMASGHIAQHRQQLEAGRAQ